MVNFFGGFGFISVTDGMFIIQFKAAMRSQFVCVHGCDDVAFAMSEEIGVTVIKSVTTGHISEVEGSPLRSSGRPRSTQSSRDVLS